MLEGNGAAKNSRKSKKLSRDKKYRKRTLYAEYTKPLKDVKIERFAKATRIDEFSKKLKLEKHLLTMLQLVTNDCETLGELSAFLKGKIARACGLEEISKSQLSVVNKNRDYRAFVWIFCELLYQIIHRHHALQRVSKELLIAGVDTTSILIKSYFSALGYCGLTKRIEEGIKLHIGAVLGKFTLPLTAWVTPLNVSDSAEFDNVLSDMGLFVDLHKVILVFDKGYWHYQRFKELAEHDIMFITQMKKKSKYTIISKKITEKYSDLIIEFKRCPNVQFRQVIHHTKDGDLEYLTDIYHLTPMQIELCYDCRWDLEVFNKDYKSNLKIEHFVGKNLNAVLIQIFSMLIAYLLIALFRIRYNSLLPLLEIKRTLRFCATYRIEEVLMLNPMLIRPNS